MHNAERDEVQAQVMKLKGVSDSIIQANKEITKCNFELAQLQESMDIEIEATVNITKPINLGVSELEHDNKLFGSDIETLLAKSKQIRLVLDYQKRNAFLIL